MKRNISDLLDTYADSNIDLVGGETLSQSRIKALTMNKLQKNKAHKRHTPIRVLLIAAIVIALSLSALAAGYTLITGNTDGIGQLFETFFENREETLSPEQVKTIDEIGRTFKAGVTSNGITVTPIAAIADENSYYLRLKIEAPEGVSLPDYNNETDGWYQLFGSEEGEELTLSKPDGTRFAAYSFHFEWLPDEFPTDNIKEVVIIMLAQPGSGPKFNDNTSKTLQFHGLWLQSPYNEYTQILSGDFSFEIGLTYEGNVISLDCKGLKYHFEDYDYTSTLKKMTISPLTLYFEFTATKPNSSRATVNVGPLRVVLKDGSVVDGLPGIGNAKGFLYSTLCQYYAFFAPIDLSQVDYVQYGDYKIPVNG